MCYRFGWIPTDRRKLAYSLPLGLYLGGLEVPQNVDQTRGYTNWGMHLNDSLGDCVVAGAVNRLILCSYADTGTAKTISDDEVQSVYFKITGGRDEGMQLTDMLSYQVKQPTTSNWNILAYGTVDPQNKLQVQQATWYLSGLKIGVMLPSSWVNPMPQASGFVWDMPRNARIVGGHDVEVCGYTPQGVQVITWNKIGTITWDSFTCGQFVQEAWGTLLDDWCETGKTPQGFSCAELYADFQTITGNSTPVPTPPAPPAPPAPVVPPTPPTPSVPPTLRGIALISRAADLYSGGYQQMVLDEIESLEKKWGMKK